MLGVGGERGHDRQRDAVRIVVADRVARGGRTARPRRAPRPGRRRRSARSRTRRPAPGPSRSTSSARIAGSVVPGRTRQSTSTIGVAGDDVVLDAGVDDVRADRVAEQRPEGPRVHRVAGRREGRLGAPRVVARRGARRIAAASAGSSAAARSRKRAITGVRRIGPGTARRSMTAAARTAALSSRGIEPWPHVPRIGDPVGGEALLGDLDRVEPAAGDGRRDAAALVERPGRAEPLGPVLGDPPRAGQCRPPPRRRCT